jgi:hypothetical protein
VVWIPGIKLEESGLDGFDHFSRGVGPNNNGDSRDGITDVNEPKPFLPVPVSYYIFHGTGIELALEDGMDDGVVVPQKGEPLKFFERDVRPPKREEGDDMTSR